MPMKTMEKRILLLLLAALLGAAAVSCRRTPAPGWRSSGLRLMGFEWKNCSRAEVPAVLTTLTLSPDPIVIPGDLTASASGRTSVELASPLTLDVTVEKEVAGFWVKIPCLEEVGSCRYGDVCDLLNQLFPPGEDCPEPLHTYGLPCHCPFKAGSYSLPQTDFVLPRIDLPFWLTNGDYRVQGALFASGRQLGCLRVALSLVSK